MKNLEKILETVSLYYKVPLKDIKGSRKNGNIPKARHVYCYISRINNYTFESIGLEINRNHTTVINSFKIICNELEIYTKIQEDIKKINDLLLSQNFKRIIVEDVDLLALTKIYNNSYIL